MPDVAATFRPRLSASGPELPNTSVVVPMVHALFVDPDTAVATSEQNGTPGAPFATIQQAVDELAGRGQGTVLLAPAIYPAEAVAISFVQLTLMGLGATQAGGADLGAVSVVSNSNVSLVNLSNVGAVVTSGNVLMRDSFSNNSVEANSLQLYSSTVGSINIVGVCEAWSSRFLDGGSAANITAKSCFFETLGTGYLFTSGGGEIWDSSFIADLLADSPTFHDSNLAGAFTGSNFTAYGCRLQGGSVNVTVSIALDLFTFQSATPASWTATSGVNIVDAPWTPQVSQLGWDASVPSTALTPLIANQHKAGLYLIYAPITVRTVAAAGTVTRTISWSAPTIGAQTEVTAAINITALGTKAKDVVVVNSTGLVDVSVQYAAVGLAGVPAIDVYAGSLQGGLSVL